MNEDREAQLHWMTICRLSALKALSEEPAFSRIVRAVRARRWLGRTVA